MKYCVKCGTKLEDSFSFCPSCGLKANESRFFKNKDSRQVEDNNNYQAVKNDTNIYAYNKKEMKKYKIQKKAKRSKGTIIFGLLIMASSVVIYLTAPGGALIAILWFIFGIIAILSSKYIGKTNFFKKQSKKVEKGMSIHQVRAMFSFIEPINEGFNRHGEYVIHYCTNKNYEKKGRDYEAIYITFDKNAKVIESSTAYHRTSSY